MHQKLSFRISYKTVYTSNLCHLYQNTIIDISSSEQKNLTYSICTQHLKIAAKSSLWNADSHVYLTSFFVYLSISILKWLWKDMIFGAISSYVYLWKGGRILKASLSFINYHVSLILWLLIWFSFLRDFIFRNLKKCQPGFENLFRFYKVLGNVQRYK